MLRPASSSVVVPSRMSPRDRQQLADDLYEVHCRIFDGVDKAAFVQYVVESKAEHTWILLHNDEQGALVGYFALHVFERVLRGVKTSVFRCEAGMLSAYRGGNVNGSFGLERALRYMLANPTRRFVYLGSLIHPSSYAQLSRYLDRVHPSPATKTSDETIALMCELADEFHLERVDDTNPLVYKVGWKTIDTPRDQHHWRRSASPAVRYFFSMNPGYTEGHGLLTLIPLDLAGIVRASARFAASKVKRWGRKFTSWAPAPLPVPVAAVA